MAEAKADPMEEFFFQRRATFFHAILLNYTEGANASYYSDRY